MHPRKTLKEDISGWLFLMAGRATRLGGSRVDLNLNEELFPCLPPPDYNWPSNTECYTAGWGLVGVSN